MSEEKKSSLMEQLEDAPTSGEENTQESKKEDDVVSIPKGLIEQLQEQLKEQKEEISKLKARSKDGGEEEEDEEEDKRQIARFKVYNDKLVVGFNKERGVWKKYDKEKREDRLMQEVIIREKDGKENTIEVDYLNFMEESKEIRLPILEIKTKEHVEDRGWVSYKTVTDYKTVDTGQKVKQKVVYKKSTALVEMPDGAKKELDMDFINI